MTSSVSAEPLISARRAAVGEGGESDIGKRRGVIRSVPADLITATVPCRPIKPPPPSLLISARSTSPATPLVPPVAPASLPPRLSPQQLSAIICRPSPLLSPLFSATIPPRHKLTPASGESTRPQSRRFSSSPNPATPPACGTTTSAATPTSTSHSWPVPPPTSPSTASSEARTSTFSPTTSRTLRPSCESPLSSEPCGLGSTPPPPQPEVHRGRHQQLRCTIEIHPGHRWLLEG